MYILKSYLKIVILIIVITLLISNLAMANNTSNIVLFDASNLNNFSNIKKATIALHWLFLFLIIKV